MTTIDRDRLRKLADKATEGPWEVEYDNEDDYEQGIAYGDFPSVLHGPESQTKWDDPRWQSEYGRRVSEISDMSAADAEFIAAAREAVPALLDALTRAEAQSETRRLNAAYWKGRAETFQQEALDERAGLLDALEQIKVRDVKIKAVTAVLDQHDRMPNSFNVPAHRIRRALDG